MRKKLAIILPLYLAGMILLTFAVLPHHHHKNYICFNVTHCETPSGEDNHHQHDADSEEAACISHLFQTQINSSSSKSVFGENHEHIPFHHSLFSCYILTETIGLPVSVVESVSYPKAPDENFRMLFLTADKASRAPPVC